MDLLTILIERVNEMVAGFIRMLRQFGLALVVLFGTWGYSDSVRMMH